MDELDCSLTTEASEFGLFRLNHFLTDPIALETLAEQVNHNPFFLERVEACAEELGKAPNLVQVDYYSIGDLFDVVRSLNGLGPGTSR